MTFAYNRRYVESVTKTGIDFADIKYTHSIPHLALNLHKVNAGHCGAWLGRSGLAIRTKLHDCATP